MHRRTRIAVVLTPFVLFIGARAAFAVNLVPNPGFESYTSCPTGFSQLFKAAPWNDPNTGTSDAYNACSPGGFPSVNVPANTFGFQNAHGGVGYAGFLVRNFNDYHEYVQAPLASALVANATYYVEFWVSLADTSNGAVDRLGAHFSSGPLSSGVNTALLVTPQVESPVNVYLNDTVNWMKVSGTFVASGGEDNIQVGNFHDDATTNVQPTGGGYPGINYYIDDILVEFVNPNADQACCLPDGSCQTTTPAECQLLGGTPLGAGTSCATSPCGPTASQRTSWGKLKGTYR
jgi:hypothetical protein